MKRTPGRSVGRAAGVGLRLGWLGLAASALATLAVARQLTPAPSGLGTHVALGLPPCGFLLSLGVPCPTCGLTTSFAHLARLELEPALRAHPLGLPLFALALLVVPLALRGAYRGDSPGLMVERLGADRVALGLALTLLVTWAARLLPG